MNSSAHLPVSESAARRVRNSKAKHKKHTKSKAAGTPQVSGERQQAAAGSLTRTKALLLAALRVWELKHRIRE
jgi:hypothetical protein